MTCSVMTAARGWAWVRLISPAAVVLIMTTAATTGRPPKPLIFEQIFSAADEPATLHYRAMFKARGSDHQLEVWRAGDRVKRVTDAALITYAVRKPHDANFDLQMLDLRKRISTHIDRTTMYRLGNFFDWFDLTHALRHPKGAYTLTRSAAPLTAAKPIDACDWYTLTEGGRASRLCWSRADRLPLLILASDGSPAWSITAVDRGALPAGVFTIADHGFVQVDAVKDTERD